MQAKREKIRTAILSALKDAGTPLSSARIHDDLLGRGMDLSERTIRLYLKEMEGLGFTTQANRRCYRISALGIQEVDAVQIIERVGFLSAKIDRMTYQMDFDLSSCSGTVVVNVSVARPKQLKENLTLLSKVYECGYAMGDMITLLPPGEKIGYTVIPDDMIGIGTVCSITLNGVLLKFGIPTNSRFGGLLEIQDRKPTRFVEIIMYSGTSLDPLEVFIRSGMTDYVGAVSTGNGRIGAGFREFPAESRPVVEDLARRLKKIGLGGFMRIGRPGQAIMEIPVGEGLVGAIVIGGLNPVAILEENNVRVHSRALAGLVDFQRLFHYREIEKHLRPFI